MELILDVRIDEWLVTVEYFIPNQKKNQSQNAIKWRIHGINFIRLPKNMFLSVNRDLAPEIQEPEDRTKQIECVY